MKRNYTVKISALLLSLALLPLSAQGQISRTSYFMGDAPVRMKLNPAMTPGRGYFNFPVIGAFNAYASSNSLGVEDVIDIVDEDDKLFNNQSFMNKLANDNSLNLSVNTDALSFGFYQGRNFWSFNTGVRFDIGAGIPKSLLTFLHDSDRDGGYNWENSTIGIGGEQLYLNAYTEIGVGLAHALTDRLTVGGKVKALVGLGNLNLRVNRLNLNTNLPADLDDLTLENMGNYYANFDIDAVLESSFKGMNLTKSEKGYIDDVDYTEFGIGGYGGAIDIGAVYRLTDRVTLSASLLDLGFISWPKANTNMAIATGQKSYDWKDYPQTEAGLRDFVADVQEFYDRFESGDILDYDMLQLETTTGEEGKARTTSLFSTLALGGEYALLNWITVGALSTTSFAKPKTVSELTLSANFCPKSWFNFAASYSVVHSGLGMAMKLGPLFVGADFLYLGSNAKSADAYLGISIPLGKRKNNFWI